MPDDDGTSSQEVEGGASSLLAEMKKLKAVAAAKPKTAPAPTKAQLQADEEKQELLSRIKNLESEMIRTTQDHSREARFASTPAVLELTKRCRTLNGRAVPDERQKSGSRRGRRRLLG